MRSRIFLALLAISLPLALLIPYAFFAQRFRVLFWVIANFYLPFWIFLGISLLGAAITAFFLYRVSRWGLFFFAITAAIITLHTAFLAMVERRHSLLVIIFLTACALVYIGEWIRRCLALPFYFSGRGLWESYPKALPGLKAWIFPNDNENQLSNTDAVEVRLSQLGAEGCFIFCLDKQVPFSPQMIQIKAGNLEIVCRVKAEKFTDDKLGVGLSFLEEQGNGDWQKDLLDRIVEMRSMGYVEA